ncbi:hypothetical protein CBM2609_A130006 [Cupriavidus taiwanensis]|nr:hypothetical protein CBM2604_A110006 [Cupriavidus taiwanensis]SOZ24596.1 hypothetical protein CBM2609_A130006 [Cupriavidus taiwanensis]SOZ44498.1 hypothetical protein CBM2610_A140006 [Cupriavidus taiwanensis]SOZ56897.1 hypothetical protein CBM2614_A250006 [Cupriavidus taiwanensis]SPA05481.1 hypothetical protein CBM2625_A200006 [Cupriavidus taiwanensis]
MWRVRRFRTVLPARLAKLKVYGRGALSGMLLVTSIDDIATGAPEQPRNRSSYAQP